MTLYQPLRVCNRCLVEQPIEEFNIWRDGIRHPTCRTCVTDLRLQRKFDITLSQYEEMLAEQDGVCAICHGEEPYPEDRRLPVDHDHDSGEVRGLLCYSCNTKLAWFEKYQKDITSYTTKEE